MGNSETKQEDKHDHHKVQDPLRDYSTEINIPSKISKPTSNMLLAYWHGNYFPCIILDKAKNIGDGYLVYFLHNQEKCEIPSSNAIGNFKALLNCTVSFSADGIDYCGKVYDVSTNEKNEVTNFFITGEDQYGWISFPFIFLTVSQARELCF